MVNGLLECAKTYQRRDGQSISTIRGRPSKESLLRAWPAENLRRFHRPPTYRSANRPDAPIKRRPLSEPCELGRPPGGPTSTRFNVADLCETGFGSFSRKKRTSAAGPKPGIDQTLPSPSTLFIRPPSVFVIPDGRYWESSFTFLMSVSNSPL
jgi:hypothetical protein